MLLLSIAVSYLIGSIPFGYLAGKAKGIDIRQHGSGNIGATNVWRTVGPAYGLLALALDALKGAAGVYLGFLSGIENVELITAIAVLIGHAFPVYLRFKGGKIIAAGLGVLIALTPPAALIALIIFVALVLLSRYVSLGSICAALSVPVSMILLHYNTLYILFGIFVCLFAIVKHVPNIKRLLAGTETKIAFKK